VSFLKSPVASSKAHLGPVITKEQERKPPSSKGGSMKNSAPFSDNNCFLSVTLKTFVIISKAKKEMAISYIMKLLKDLSFKKFRKDKGNFFVDIPKDS
jgi:hypothetical protein